ncbi:MAG TPA: hypothetical protein GYA10_05710 [Alphaproteobacteria bacterium]|nr:hypothetical protein [Alphaproteobacteria bacterium]
MTRTSISLALLAAAAVTAIGLAVPAAASDETFTFNEDAVLATLHERGINASSLAEWNGTIRATVTLADGSSRFEYFDANTLQPVNGPVAGNGNSSVLSKLDVGAARAVPAPSLNSLTWVDPDTQQ